MKNDETIYVIGDIHGCFKMFEKLMEEISWQPEKDKLIFLGDYIDRGPDSKEVVEYIVGLKKKYSNIRCLLGNHEICLLNYFLYKDSAPFLMNGGEKTIISYELNNGNRIPEEHFDFFKSLETYIELDNYYFVHAGFRPGIKIKKQEQDDLLWIRDPFISSEYDFGKRVIFGHTSFSAPLIMPNKIGLDTGAVFGNKLTCLKLPDMNFFHVEAGSV
jgi:serine/threonine protein phosphatase 1